MGEERANRAYELWRDAAEKFDYFMAGVSVAIVGYIAPTLQFSKLGLNPSSLELFSMLVLIGSVGAAFKRIESTVHLQRVAVARLEKLESVQRLSTAIRNGIPAADSETSAIMDGAEVSALLGNRQATLKDAHEQEKKVRKWAVRWSSLRHYLFVVGFLFLVAARVWKADF